MKLALAPLSAPAIFLLLSACSEGDSGTDAADTGGGDEIADADGESADEGDAGPDDAAPVTLDLIPGCNPFATSIGDPSDPGPECILPIPSSFFERTDATSRTGVRGSYPPDILPNRDGVTHFNLESANRADGYSPAGPILLHFGADIDPAHLRSIHDLERSTTDGEPIALFNLETGRRIPILTEMDLNRSTAYPGRYVLIIRPMEPLQMGTRHVVALTNALRTTEGLALESPPAFAALRDGVPTTNDELESRRADFEGLFDFLAAHGYPREDLFLAWDYVVASRDWILGPVLSMRQTALSLVEGTGLSYTIDEIQEDPNENVSRIVMGTFEVPTFLTTENVFVYDDENRPVRQEPNQSFPYTMIVPRVAATEDRPLPLMVFGHGIFGEGRDYLTGSIGTGTLQPTAQQNGVIVVATDWIGLSAADFDIILREVVPDLNRLGVITDRLQQALINNLTLVELVLGDLQHDARLAPAGHDLIEEGPVLYYGVSLGGIQGSSFISISKRIERGVLAVPGSVWSNMLPRSSVWTSIKPFFDIQYPDPLVQQMATAFVQTRFDFSDPINLTTLLFQEPLPDAPAGRRVLVQESIGDSQVPNMTTEMLARGLALKQLSPANSEIYGLEQLAPPAHESAIAQYYLREQADANFPPESNVPPASDNGVHSDMCFLPNVMQQVVEFLFTGTISQFCDGPCDPD
ncbi:MAG: hypothetical protein HY905_27220 [Deltaproteobacteria bacterium]|nr:hypothetical protein [Deltaproteobacteria bacterium]